MMNQLVHWITNRNSGDHAVCNLPTNYYVLWQFIWLVAHQ